MSKKHVNVNFHDLKQMELVPFARRIVSLMTEHVAIFAKPPVPLADVTKLINAYSAVLGKEEYGGEDGGHSCGEACCGGGVEAVGAVCE